MPPMKNTLFNIALSGESEGADSNHYKGFSMDDVDVLGRLVVAFIDPQSDCARERDIPYRKKLAVDAVSSVVKVTRNALREFNEENILFTMMVADFFMVINSIAYESWLSFNIQFHKLNEELRKGSASGKDIRGMIQSLELIEKELLKRTNMIFPTDRMATQVAELETAKTMGGWAEEYAREQPWLEL